MTAKKDKNDLKALEKELCSFYDFCKENNFSQEEIKQLVSPIQKLLIKTKLFRYFKYLMIIIIIIICFNYLLKIDSVSWHAAAIGRIAMIQLLPYWNWQTLYGQKCLLYGFKKDNYVQNFDCTVCESINSIPVEENVDPEILSETFLEVNIPVLISDGLKNFPNHNVTEYLLKNNVLGKSYPCEINNNFLSKNTDVYTLVKRAQKFKKHFLHFQNCELNAVKAFRALAPRPYFLKPEVAPIQYNWVLMSKNYNSPNYKLINLRERITIVAQLEGSNYIQLIPRKNCLDVCPLIRIKLHKNEALLFGSLWDFEYKPFENGTNIAVVLETN